MDIRPSRPGEDEQARGQQQDGEQRREETVLLGAEAVFGDVGLEVPVHVRQVGHQAQHAPDDDTHEDGALLAQIEAILADIYQREGFKVRVVDAVDERCVGVGEEDGRVLHADLERAVQAVGRDSGERLVALVDFRLRLQHLVARQGAQTPSPAEENVVCGGLGKAQEHQDEHGARHPEDFPQRPAPVLGDDGEA